MHEGPTENHLGELGSLYKYYHYYYYYYYSLARAFSRGSLRLPKEESLLAG